MSVIKHCPFCGSDSEYNELRVSISCLSCGAHGPTADNLNDAIEDWNIRIEVENESINWEQRRVNMIMSAMPELIKNGFCRYKTPSTIDEIVLLVDEVIERLKRKK